MAFVAYGLPNGPYGLLMAYSLYGLWHLMAYGLNGLGPAYGLYGFWPIWPMDFLAYSLYGLRP